MPQIQGTQCTSATCGRGMGIADATPLLGEERNAHAAARSAAARRWSSRAEQREARGPRQSQIKKNKQNRRRTRPIGKVRGGGRRASPTTSSACSVVPRSSHVGPLPTQPLAQGMAEGAAEMGRREPCSPRPGSLLRWPPPPCRVAPLSCRGRPPV